MLTADSLTVRTAQRPGGTRPSEDRIFQTDNAVIVLDGATQAFALERTGGWIADEVGRRLVVGLKTQPDADLRDLLKRAIVDLVGKYDLKPGESPSTTVSIARFDNDIIDILVLGDSPVVVLDINDQVVEIRDGRLAAVSSSIPRPDGLGDMTKPEWVDRMTIFETYRNKPGGFWCVSASPEAADQAFIRQLRADECRLAMLMTDGVSAIVDSYQTLAGWHEAISIAAESPSRLVDLVHETELRDLRAEKWPRGKTHDDKALALIRQSG